MLFTDIEASTRLLQRLGERYAAVLDEHRCLLRASVEAHGGHEVDTQGDAFFAAFPRAADAVQAALVAQRALAEQEWPDGAAVGVRMGLHTGEPTPAGSGYVGLDVHRAARLCAAGHGGQVLLSQTTRDLVGPGLSDGLGLRDLGEHHLKDLRLPERVYQLVAPGLPAEFPPLRSLDTCPNNLPRQLTSFVGREREMAEVKQLLEANALLTLTGTGGAGKTRLALQVAADLVDAYPDGVWLVELAPLAEPALMPQAVASALGLQEEPRRPLVETLIEHLRSRELLLVLDNCEHLISACATLADSLLRACSRLKVLATSREPLGIGGEAIWRVPSLSLPDPERLPPLEQLPSYEAARLFIDRALAVRLGFAVTNENAPAFVEVCHRLDGIPLAIELAAARVSALTVEQIAARLDQRFRLLTGGSRTALPRQQTLRALVDWSYDLLSEPERLLLRRLAVFAGGWTLEAAEAVCAFGAGSGVGSQESGAVPPSLTPSRSGATGSDSRLLAPDDVLDLLSTLVNKSLVLAEEQGGEARYGLLETIRQYGLEKLEESGEEPTLRQRHRDWFLTLAQAAERELRGPLHARWLFRFEAEHDNFRAALTWSTTTPGEAEAGLRIAIVATNFWSLRGDAREGRVRLADLLARAPERTAARAGGLTAAGYLALRQGDYAAALPLLEESLTLWRELGDKAGLARALRTLGEALYGRGEHARAKLLLEESLALYRALREISTVQDESWALPRVLSCLADIAYDQANHAQAAGLYEEALTVARQQEHTHDIGYALRGLGHLARLQGEHERATMLVKESLVLLAKLKDRRCVPLCVEGLACVASARGQAERAARLFGAAETLREAIGVTLLPAEQADHEQAVAAARAGLDADSFDRAWAQGRTMTFDEAAEYALAAEAPVDGLRPDHPPPLPQGEGRGRQRVSGGDPGEGGQASLLTPREREIVALIARGLTNSQIADELVLSVRTVERHIENIYGKVGAHGKAARAAVTGFALRHGLIEPE